MVLFYWPGNLRAVGIENQLFKSQKVHQWSIQNVFSILEDVVTIGIW